MPHYLGMLEPETQLYEKFPAACTALLAHLLAGSEHPQQHAEAIFDKFVRQQAGETSDHTMRTALVSVLGSIRAAQQPQQTPESSESAIQQWSPEAGAGVADPDLALAVLELVAANSETSKSVAVEVPEALLALLDTHLGYLLEAVAERFNDGRYSYAFSGRHRAVVRVLLQQARGDEAALLLFADSLEGAAGSSCAEVAQEAARCAISLAGKTATGRTIAVGVLRELNVAEAKELAALVALEVMEAAAREQREEDSQLMIALQEQSKVALGGEHQDREVRQRIAVLASRRPVWATRWWPCVLPPEGAAEPASVDLEELD